MSNGETILKNEDSINVRSYILFFSFRRFLPSRSLSLGSLLTSRSRIFHTRNSHSTSLPLLFNLFFSLFISPFLSHTRTLSPSVSCLTQLMQNVPTRSDKMCVCVRIPGYSLFNQSSRSHFARCFPHFFSTFPPRNSLDFFFPF